MTTRLAAAKGMTTELHRATLIGDLGAVRKCLAAGHAIDPRDPEGHTPFLLACKHSEPEVFHLLRLAGADLHAASSNGMSGLFLVATSGVVSLARLLIKTGADVNRPAARGLTPLIAAIMSENAHMVRLLIAAGANVRHVDAVGTSVLKWARKVGTRELVELIAHPERAAEATTASLGTADLHRAARTGDAALIRDCLAAGLPADDPDGDSITPLMLAARRGKRAAIQALLEAGADPYRVAPSGMTPVLLAADNPVALRPFALAGVDLNHTVGRRRLSPLIYAARQGLGDVVQFLVQSGADPGRTDADGLTAYDHALANGHRRTALMLQDAGATAGTGRHATDLRATLPA